MSDTLLTPSSSVNLRVSDRNVIRAERIKFTSVRSNVITLLGGAAAMIAFGALFTAFAGSGEGPGPRDEMSVSDSLSISFGSLVLTQLVLGVLGALFVASEYSNGLIRVMFASVPKRLAVLRAKTAVIGVGTWIVMTVAAFVTFFVGQALYAGDQATYGLFDDGVLRVVLGSGLYAAGIAVMGVALGFLLRSTATAIATLIGLLMIAPGLIGLLPDSVADPVTKILPSQAGAAFRELRTTSDSLSPAAGLAVFVAWLVGLLGIAAWSLRTRDA